MTKFLIKNRPEYNISENFQYNGSPKRLIFYISAQNV